MFHQLHQMEDIVWVRTMEWVKEQSNNTATDSEMVSHTQAYSYDYEQHQKIGGKSFNGSYVTTQVSTPPRAFLDCPLCGPVQHTYMDCPMVRQYIHEQVDKISLNVEYRRSSCNDKAKTITFGNLDQSASVKRDPQQEVTPGGYRVHERHPEVGSQSFTRLGETSAQKGNLSTSGIEKALQHTVGLLTQLGKEQQEFNYGMVEHLRMARDSQSDQAEALVQLVETSQQRELKKLYDNIPIYDGIDPDKFEPWLNQLENACIVGKRDPRKVAICSSIGPLSEAIRSIDAEQPWSIQRAELRRCFSPCKTTVHAVDLLSSFRHKLVNENLRSYIMQYVQLHRQATGLSPGQDYDIGRKTEFLKRLRNPVLANKIVRSAAFKNFNAYSLEKCFARALELEGDFQVSKVVTHT